MGLNKDCFFTNPAFVPCALLCTDCGQFKKDLLCRNHARQKTKRGDRYRIAMGPRVLTASSGLAPWSMAVDRRQHGEKSNHSWGSRGLAPLGCLPHWGREGVTLAISTPSQKTRRRFLQSRKIISHTESSEYSGVDDTLKEREKEKRFTYILFRLRYRPLHNRTDRITIPLSSHHQILINAYYQRFHLQIP